ncbi:MAG: hypothetical protein WEB00_15415 [Dehalococcoidia bacterium]
MTKRAILAAQYRPNWSSFVGALEGVLEALGDEADTDWLMGVTGHAFRGAASTGPEGFIRPETWLVANHAASLALYRNAGRELEYIESSSAESDFAAVKAEAVKRIHKAIDRGIPVIGGRLHVPEFGIIRGYNEQSKAFYVSTISQEQTGETMPIATWPVSPERHMQIFIPGKRRKVSPAEALLDALRFACDYAERGEGPEFERESETSHGFQAIDMWARALADGTKLSGRPHAHNAQVVLSARQYAVRFLRRGAELAPASDRLLGAAEAYLKAMLEWTRFCTLFPYPGGGDIQGQAAYNEGAGYLRRALVHERVAIEQLREALVHWS